MDRLRWAAGPQPLVKVLKICLAPLQVQMRLQRLPLFGFGLRLSALGPIGL